LWFFSGLRKLNKHRADSRQLLPRAYGRLA
jgi:hypothetical protein